MNKMKRTYSVRERIQIIYITDEMGNMVSECYIYDSTNIISMIIIFNYNEINIIPMITR